MRPSPLLHTTAAWGLQAFRQATQGPYPCCLQRNAAWQCEAGREHEDRKTGLERNHLRGYRRYDFNINESFRMTALQCKQVFLSHISSKFWQSLPGASLCLCDVAKRGGFDSQQWYWPHLRMRRLDENMDISIDKYYLILVKYSIAIRPTWQLQGFIHWKAFNVALVWLRCAMQHLHAWPNGQGLSKRFGDLENSVFAGRVLEHWTSQFVLLTQMLPQARNIDVLWYKSDSTGFLGNVHVHIKANSRCCKCHFFAPSPWWQTTLRIAMQESTWNAKPQPFLTVTAKKARQVSSLVAASIKAPMQAASMSCWMWDTGYVHKKVFCVHKILKDDVNPATCLC